MEQEPFLLFQQRCFEICMKRGYSLSSPLLSFRNPRYSLRKLCYSLRLFMLMGVCLSCRVAQYRGIIQLAIYYCPADISLPQNDAMTSIDPIYLYPPSDVTRTCGVLRLKREKAESLQIHA